MCKQAHEWHRWKAWQNTQRTKTAPEDRACHGTLKTVNRLYTKPLLSGFQASLKALWMSHAQVSRLETILEPLRSFPPPHSGLSKTRSYTRDRSGCCRRWRKSLDWPCRPRSCRRSWWSWCPWRVVCSTWGAPLSTPPPEPWPGTWFCRAAHWQRWVEPARVAAGWCCASPWCDRIYWSIWRPGQNSFLQPDKEVNSVFYVTSEKREVLPLPYTPPWLPVSRQSKLKVHIAWMLLYPVPWNSIRSSMSNVRLTFCNWVFFLGREGGNGWLLQSLCLSYKRAVSMLPHSRLNVSVNMRLSDEFPGRTGINFSTCTCRRIPINPSSESSGWI